MDPVAPAQWGSDVRQPYGLHGPDRRVAPMACSLPSSRRGNRSSVGNTSTFDAAGRLRSTRHFCCDTRTSGSALRPSRPQRSEEHTSELQSRPHLVCRLLLEKKKQNYFRVCCFYTEILEDYVN